MLSPRARIKAFTVRYPLSLIYILLFCTFAFTLYWAHHVDQRSIERVRMEAAARTNETCHSVQNEWDTFQHVIDAAVKPPVLAGKSVSPEQRKALTTYHDSLIAELGERPNCQESK